MVVHVLLQACAVLLRAMLPVFGLVSLEKLYMGIQWNGSSFVKILALFTSPNLPFFPGSGRQPRPPSAMLQPSAVTERRL